MSLFKNKLDKHLPEEIPCRHFGMSYGNSSKGNSLRSRNDDKDLMSICFSPSIQENITGCQSRFHEMAAQYENAASIRGLHIANHSALPLACLYHQWTTQKTFRLSLHQSLNLVGEISYTWPEIVISSKDITIKWYYFDHIKLILSGLHSSLYVFRKGPWSRKNLKSIVLYRFKYQALPDHWNLLDFFPREFSVTLTWRKWRNLWHFRVWPEYIPFPGYNQIT